MSHDDLEMLALGAIIGLLFNLCALVRRRGRP